MLRLAGSAFIVLLTAAAVQAQSIGEPLPGRGPAKERAKPARVDTQASRPCPEYGPGFVRVEGSSACVRVGGAVRAEFGKSSRNGTGSAAGGMAYLETRSETGIGSVRTVIQARGQLERNLPTGPYRY
ncbi:MULTISPECIES: porin [Bosea]|jgi:hypothetical protein|uniref:porin n=1 Tax=Bosea TaxID=85413 RepID=UPI0006BAD9BE|nr:porin [Bosea vaviloviae]